MATIMNVQLTQSEINVLLKLVRNEIKVVQSDHSDHGQRAAETCCDILKALNEAE